MSQQSITPLEVEFQEALLRDPARCQAAFQAFAAGLRSRGLLYADRPLPTSFKPHFLHAATTAPWARAAERLTALLERIGPLLRQDPELYRRLGFEPEAQALLAIDPGYAAMTPICRPDGVYQGDRIRFVEINSAAPAGGTKADLLEDLVLSLFPMRELSQRWPVERRDRTRGMLDAILTCYRDSGGAAAAPRIAIVGWSDSPNWPERRCTAEAWTQLGVPTCTLDARELSYERGRLWAHGEPIDIVNRRLALRDFIRRSDALAPLLRAYRDGTVCMVSPLRAELVANKGTLALLHDDAFRKALSEAERALIDDVIPYTCFVDPAARAVLLTDPVSWVLKPAAGSGGDRVLFGRELSADAWRGAVERAAASAERWIAQRVSPTSRYEIIEETPGGIGARSLYVNWNPLIQAGRYCGATARGSDRFCVNLTSGGAVLTSLELQA